MADDDKLSLHVDTDWKKQAQEEKRRLAEQAQQRSTAAPPPPRMPPAGAGLAGVPADPRGGVGAPGAAIGPGRGSAAGVRGRREMPPAGFATLVQSIMTQALFYLGELAPQGAEPTLNLDMAKHQIDTLNVLEEKTVNNLSDDEKRLLDAALYETRTRFIAVAQQFIG